MGPEELVIAVIGDAKGWVRAVIVATLCVSALMWRYLRQIRTVVRDSAHAARTSAEVVVDVKREFANNGGATAKDQLDRIERALVGLDDRLLSLEEGSRR